MSIKNTILTFFFIFSISFISPIKASHTLGGEIFWECVGNGKYVFHVRAYRDCTGIPFQFQNQTLTVTGSQLPRDANNATISSITVRHDVARFNRLNAGDMSPSCGNASNTISCQNNDQGAVQEIPYISDTLELRGTPPQNGWNFFYVFPCCRPNVTNLAITGNQIFKATMYPYLNTPVDSCIDNSPRFAEIQEYFVCTDFSRNVDFSALDIDGDRISYHFDRTYNLPVSSPQAVPYAGNYSLNNPTVDSATTFNFPAQLNSGSGLLSMDFFNPPSQVLDFMLVVRADAWRGNHRIASSYQEIPLAAFNCPNLPNLNPNLPPVVSPPFYKGGTTFSFADTVTVGSLVNMNLQVLDTNTINGAAQNIRIDLKGASLSRDLQNSALCTSPFDTLCATAFGTTQFDSSKLSHYFSAVRSWNSMISWQTDCDDLQPDGTAKTHYFYVKVRDDFCPVPAVNTEVIAVTVLPDPVVCQNVATSLEEAPSFEPKIYPNPSNGLVFIETISKERLNVQIFDLQGKMVQEEIVRGANNSVQLPQQKGIYLLKILNSKGESRSFKLIRD